MIPNLPATAAARLRALEEADLRDRRRRFRATTMSERIEAAIRLSRFASDLRGGMTGKRR